MTLEKFIEEMGHLWKDKIKDTRDTTVWTGRGGAINYLEMLKGRPLTPQERRDVKDGMYEISSAKGLVYVGLYDPDIPNGIHVFKNKDGKYTYSVYSSFLILLL